MTVRAHPARRRLGTTALAGITTTCLALTACGGSADQGAESDGKLTIVTSTDVWGNVAKSIGGEQVEVESIITDPNVDPHSYESTPRDAATISDADLVLYNGGGYDEFIPQLLSADSEDKPTVQAVEDDEGGEHGHEHGEDGHDHDHGDNEHVWYDPHQVGHVAEDLAAQLGELRPENTEQFNQAAEQFKERTGGLEDRIAALAEKHRGKQVIVTEPIAHYLVQEAKLRDVTPDSFVNAVESETDPPAQAVAAITDRVSSGQADAVIYNPQTESPVTRNVHETAEGNGVPVVTMTETLPAEQDDYIAWLGQQIDKLDKALDG